MTRVDEVPAEPGSVTATLTARVKAPFTDDLTAPVNPQSQEPNKESSLRHIDQSGVLRRILRRPLGFVSLLYLSIVALGSIFASALASVSPLKADFLHTKSGPTSLHWLGTDSLGRDILSRILFGGRASLTGVAEALLVLFLIGVPAGLLAGYFGGWFDRLITSISDIMLSIPTIVFLLLVLSIFRANLHIAMITLGCLLSPGLMRVTRAASLAVRNELYVTAARTSGLSHPAIIARHVLKRIIGAVIVQMSIAGGVALAVQSGLAFLGLGIKPPDPSWGFDLSDATTLMVESRWPLVPPAAVIGLCILAFGLLGDAVRDANAERWSSVRKKPNRSSRPLVLSVEPSEQTKGAVLVVRGLTIAFDAPQGSVTAVEDVSFHVFPGETIGLVGESGCGKTLSVLGVMGLLPGAGRIKSGSVRLADQELVGLDDKSLRALRGSKIAYISQEPMSALNPAFRVGQLLDAAVKIHHGLRGSAARDRTIALLRTVRLTNPEQVAQKYPHELSGGMAQRVAIALALSGEPNVLIADEPTTALDVTVQAEILDLLRAIQTERGMAIVLVTHDWGVICDLATRAIVMYAGQVAEEAPVAEIVRTPRHPYTAALLASDPHRVSAHVLPTIPGTVPAPGAWPVGCHFAARCQFAMEACATGAVVLTDRSALAVVSAPTGRETGTSMTRRVRCLRADELDLTLPELSLPELSEVSRSSHGQRKGQHV
jgi:peptide/nickel transport system permease protein